MRRCAIMLAALVLAISAVPMVWAQDAAKRSVDVTVTDQFGRSVSGLQQSNFAVKEGGVRREITAFAQLQADGPKNAVHYRLEFESAGQSATLEVVFNPPRRVPRLTVAWK